MTQPSQDNIETVYDQQYTVLVSNKGHEKWFIDGDLVKERTRLGLEAYYLNDKYHREYEPALTDVSGNRYYYIYGILHREDGPAIEYADGDKEWFLYGKNLIEERFLRVEIPDLFKTLKKCKTETCAYQMAKGILTKALENDVNKFKLLKYISVKNNPQIPMILRAMGDSDFSLSKDFVKIILKYIDEDDEDLFQAACIALLFGGVQANQSLITKIVPNDKYRKVLRFVLLTKPDFYSSTKAGQEY